MDKIDEFGQAMNTLEVAEKELIDAQTTGNVSILNQAHYKLQLAQELLNKLEENETVNHQQSLRLKHAKEHLRHLLETEISIQ
jgi:hypothetical protein